MSVQEGDEAIGRRMDRGNVKGEKCDVTCDL